eukprot:884494-Prymnesium_polylepis.2
MKSSLHRSPVSAPFASLCTVQLSSHPHQVSGVLTDVWEATSRLRSTEVLKGNKYELRTFEGYCGRKATASNTERASMIYVPTSLTDAKKVASARKSHRG